MKNGLLSPFACAWMYLTALAAWSSSKVGEAVVGDRAEVLGRLSGDAFPIEKDSRSR